MGQECTTCKTCTDQEEIKAEQSISANHIVTKTANGVKDKIHKTSQKSTNQTATTSQTNNNNTKSPQIQKKYINQKYKRKEGRKSTLDSIIFNSKKNQNLKKNLDNQ